MKRLLLGLGLGFILGLIWFYVVIAAFGVAFAELPKPKPKVEEKSLYHCFFDHTVVPADAASLMMQRHGYDYVVIFLWQGKEEKPSILLAYNWKGYGQIHPYPAFYLIDRDFDGRYDEEWDDMDGSGRCKAMRQFPVIQPDDKES